MYNCDSKGHFFVMALFGTLGVGVFVQGFAIQWNGGGTITIMALMAYLVSMLLVGTGLMMWYGLFGIHEKKSKKK
ncbi:hypothetical protein ACFLQI_00880 [Candidatus Undinarchaeota archaeon]